MLVTSALGYAAQLGLAFAAAGTMLGARAVGAADTAAYGQLAHTLHSATTCVCALCLRSL